MNGETAVLLLLTNMQGGDHSAEQKTHARKLEWKHDYNFRSTIPDKKTLRN